MEPDLVLHKGVTHCNSCSTTWRSAPMSTGCHFFPLLLCIYLVVSKARSVPFYVIYVVYVFFFLQIFLLLRSSRVIFILFLMPQIIHIWDIFPSMMEGSKANAILTLCPILYKLLLPNYGKGFFSILFFLPLYKIGSNASPTLCPISYKLLPPNTRRGSFSEFTVLI